MEIIFCNGEIKRKFYSRRYARRSLFFKENLKDRNLVFFFFSEFIRMLFFKKFGGLTEC